MEKPRDDEAKQASIKTDIYKIYVNTAEANIERRQKVNQFYFSVVAAIFVAFGYLADGKWKAAISDGGQVAQQTGIFLPLALLSLLLLIVSSAWRQQLKLIQTVSLSKFAVIDQLEADLPMRPFAREAAAREKAMVELKIARSGSQIEMRIPQIFFWLALLALVASVIVLALPLFYPFLR